MVSEIGFFPISHCGYNIQKAALKSYTYSLHWTKSTPTGTSKCILILMVNAYLMAHFLCNKLNCRLLTTFFDKLVHFYYLGRYYRNCLVQVIFNTRSLNPLDVCVCSLLVNEWTILMRFFLIGFSSDKCVPRYFHISKSWTVFLEGVTSKTSVCLRLLYYLILYFLKQGADWSFFFNSFIFHCWIIY